MRFSIVIPNYNNGHWLKSCLDSILEQTFTDYEIIIVDDMSEDESLETARQYAKEHKDKIQLIELKTKRLCGGTRNEGIIRAKGDYLYFVDGDDKLKDKDVLQYFNDNISDEDIIYVGIETILENSRGPFIPYYPTKFDAYKSTACAPFTKIIKRKICPFFPEGTLFDDRIHHYWTLNNAQKIKCLNKVVYEWNRLNYTSAMHTGIKWDVGNFNYAGMLYKLILDTEEKQLKDFYIQELKGYIDWINGEVKKLWT